MVGLVTTDHSSGQDLKDFKHEFLRGSSGLLCRQKYIECLGDKRKVASALNMVVEEHTASAVLRMPKWTT
jgi:hypothetical protein